MLRKRTFLKAVLIALTACNTVEKPDETVDTGGLSFEPGLMWAEKFFYSTDTEQGKITKSGEFIADGSLSHDGSSTAGVRVSKVVSTTFVEALAKHGYLIQSVEKSTTEYMNDGLSIPGDPGLEWLSARILVSVNGWVRSMVASNEGGYVSSDSSVYSASDDEPSGVDYDVWQGDALYPVDPKSGAYYTSDNGSIFKVGGRKLLVRADAVSLAQKYPEEPLAAESFYKTCFSESTFGDSKYVSVESGCEAYISWSGFTLPHYSNEMWIGRGLNLQSTSRQEMVVATRICCNDICESIYPGVTVDFYNNCSEFDSITFDGYRRTRFNTTEIVRFGKANNPHTQPKISDVEATHE